MNLILVESISHREPFFRKQTTRQACHGIFITYSTKVGRRSMFSHNFLKWDSSGALGFGIHEFPIYI